MKVQSSTPRPFDLRTVILKHSMDEAKDCELCWKADFGKMEILLYTSIISPVLILDFLAMLPKRDERFPLTAITDIVQITSRFNMKLIIQSDGYDVCYEVRVFRFQESVNDEYRYGLELL